MATQFLIFGANGAVGKQLCIDLRAEGETVIGASHSPGPGQLPYDFRSSKPQSLNLSRDHDYVACICSAQANIDACAADPETSHRLNVSAPLALLDYLKSFSASIVFASTDNVFDGAHAPYSEMDHRAPLNLYGRQKVMIEDAIRAGHDRHVIVRMSKIFGTGPDNILMKQARSLLAGERLTTFSDQVFAPLFIEDLPRFVLAAHRAGATGTYHLAQNEALTRHEQVSRLAESIGADKRLLDPTTMSQARLREPRPLNATLSNRRARDELSFSFTSLEQVLTRLKAEL